jgi:hypothetical protein
MNKLRSENTHDYNNDAAYNLWYMSRIYIDSSDADINISPHFDS